VARSKKPTAQDGQGGLTPAKLASLFKQAGCRVTAQSIRQDIRDGAPTVDGLVPFTRYVIWLYHRMMNDGV
jgi:hypothetical protein